MIFMASNETDRLKSHCQRGKDSQGATMNEKPMTRAEARRFLLGAVDDSERQQIESLFMVDPETQETILIAEDELVEDYLEGSLSESDTAKFLQQYAHGPQQRRKLRILESIKEYGHAEALQRQSENSALQRLRLLISLRWLRERRWYIPIAVAAVLVITAVWVVQRNNLRMRDEKLRLAIEQQFTDLNAPSSLRENPPQMLTLVIPSVSLRSVNSTAEIRSQAAHRIIELQLLWPHNEESQSYLAVLHRVDGTERFTIANLHEEKNPSGRVVRLRLPAQSLAPGLYQVSLSAVAGDSTLTATEDYEFTISR
jgi:hypothetical protein